LYNVFLLLFFTVAMRLSLFLLNEHDDDDKKSQSAQIDCACAVKIRQKIAKSIVMMPKFASN